MKPTEVPLHFTRTDDARVHILFTASAAPFDLTDYQLVAEVRAKADPLLVPLATFTVTRGATGEVTLGLEEEATAALPARSYWSFRTYLPALDYWQTWLAGSLRVDYTGADTATANDYTVTVGPDEVEVVLAATVGPPGPPGPDGDPGQQGTTGQSAYDLAVVNGFVGTEQEWLASLAGGLTSYEHTQVTPSTVWTMQHNLGYRPAGFRFITDQDGWVEEDSIAYSSTSVAVATFTFAYSGTGYVS